MTVIEKVGTAEMSRRVLQLYISSLANLAAPYRKIIKHVIASHSR